MDLLLGFDIGTTALKGVLCSPERGIIAEAKRSTEQLRPQPGFVEFSSVGCYELLCDAIRELVTHAPADSAIGALALSGATGNTVLLDNSGEPLGNAISWMDGRVGDRWPELLPGLDADEVYRVVGWPFGGGFPLGHLGWLRKNLPERYARADRHVMNITYLTHRLSGRYACDPSTATTFYLQNQVAQAWHQPYVDMLGLDAARMPEILPSGSSLGPLTATACRDTGLSPGTELVLGSFDHPSAARGVGISRPGQLLLSCGTSWVGFYPMTTRENALAQRLLIDPFLHPDGPWGPLFALTSMGVAIDALLDSLVFEDGPRDFVRLNEAAASAAPGSDGLMLNPRDPHVVENARLSSVIGDFGREQRSRAIMEGAAYEMRRRILQLEAAGVPARDITMVGGPSESPVWTQIMADICGLPIRLTNGQVAGALGAAIMAGIGVDLFDDAATGYDVLCTQATLKEPDSVRSGQYSELYDAYIAAHQ